MRKIKYLFKRFFKMNFKEMFKTANRISKKTKKNLLIIFIDIIYCGYKYMAGYVDYEVFNFVNLTKEQRKTIITRGVNNSYVAKLNNKDYTYLLSDKIEFNKKFNNFLNRSWLDLRNCSLESFVDFATKLNSFIAKPIDLACGKNIEKYTINENTNFEKLYNSLINNKQFLLEEYIIQHPKMSKLHPSSVNTLRIVTVNKNNNVNIMFRSIRIGNSGNVVDNFNHGGLFTTIQENGEITKPAVNKQGEVFENHPYTNTPIVGFKIPLFDEAINYVKKLCVEIPEVGYIGWDIAITENGPVVVEANPFPGHDIYQSKIHMNSDGTGMKQFFDNIILN